MTTVVGVRFREVGKIYYFAPGDLSIAVGDNVIVDTIRGTEYGTCIIGPREVEDENIVQPLRTVRRIATPDDAERVRVNREKEKDAFDICKEKIREHGLEMKLISAEYTFDNAKVLFYFTADGRIDFRDLVKDLASVFRIRIELRQVGVRDETKLMGGLGGCGRPLCCASYLSDFVPVSIRMAKEQNLSLNPQKISGMCGRLMCCLKNEAETYEYLNARLPRQGDRVITPDGRDGVAETVNVLRQKVRVLFTDEDGTRQMEEYPASELKFTPRKKKHKAEDDQDVVDTDVSEMMCKAAMEEAESETLELPEDADDMEDAEDSDTEETRQTSGEQDKPHRKRKHHRRKKRPDNGGEQSASAAGEDRRPGAEQS